MKVDLTNFPNTQQSWGLLWQGGLGTTGQTRAKMRTSAACEDLSPLTRTRRSCTIVSERSRMPFAAKNERCSCCKRNRHKMLCWLVVRHLFFYFTHKSSEPNSSKAAPVVSNPGPVDQNPTGISNLRGILLGFPLALLEATFLPGRKEICVPQRLDFSSRDLNSYRRSLAYCI